MAALSKSSARSLTWFPIFSGSMKHWDIGNIWLQVSLYFWAAAFPSGPRSPQTKASRTDLQVSMVQFACWGSNLIRVLVASPDAEGSNDTFSRSPTSKALRSLPWVFRKLELSSSAVFPLSTGGRQDSITRLTGSCILLAWLLLM